MKILFTFLSLFLICCLQAQTFKTVDERVRSYPKNIGSAEQLAAQIAHDFSTDTERVRAIYTWLATNITYDLAKFYKGDTRINFSYADQEDLQRKLNAVNTHTINETMRTKKAVCEGYAQTFKKVSELLKIPCLFITGYSKTSIQDIGKSPKQEDHAWNAVRIDDTWRLIDATWGAGVTQNGQWKPRFDSFFFFTEPDDFILSHLPGEAELSFTGRKVSVSNFFKKPLFSHAYFKNNLELVSPRQGEIRVRTDSKISFEIDNIPQNMSLHYAFRENMRPTLIEPTCQNSKCKFSIPFTGTRNTELFIIANRETALQYKVSVIK